MAPRLRGADADIEAEAARHPQQVRRRNRVAVQLTPALRTGALLALASGTAFGVTVVVGRRLAETGVTSETALGIRFTLSALLMLGVRALMRKPIVPVRGERWAAFLLGAIGYALESSCFYLALGRGTAAAVGLVFYSYPAVVTILEVVTGRTLPSMKLVVAIVLSVGGVALVVGTAEKVAISATGVAFALAASLSFSLYFLASHRFATRTETGIVAAWVSLGAGLSIALRGVVLDRLEFPDGRWPTLLGYAIANSVAFAAMFAALRRLGPTRTSVLLTVEVVATVVLAALFLDETLRAIQLVGGVAIAAGAVLATVAHVDADDVIPAGEPP